MPDHTPGPWTARYDPVDHWWVIDSPGPVVGPFISVSGDRGEADARLVAASPELLEACKAVLAAFPFRSEGCLYSAALAVVRAEGRGAP